MTSDELILRFGEIRAERDRLRARRAGLFCARAEPVSPFDYEDAHAEAQADPLARFEFPEPTQPEPCWKAARKWRDNGYRSEFYFDPPQSEWCAQCRERQAVSDAYRQAVRKHGGALRGLLRRARSLSPAAGRVTDARTPDAGPRAGDQQETT